MSTSKPPGLVIGPVVGWVTPTTARILVEVDAALQVTLFLAPADKPSAKLVSVAQSLPASRATVFAFDDLVPQTQYEIQLQIGRDTEIFRNRGTVTTHPLRTPTNFFNPWEYFFPKTFKFGVLSCNNIDETRLRDHVDVWVKLREQIAFSELQVLFHIGDQVYADGDYYRVMNKKISLDDFLKEIEAKGQDSKYGRAMKLVTGKSRQEAEALRPQIEEMFRDIYRETWSHPVTAYVLAHVSNVMILDDHEIRDDWGQNEADYDRGSNEYLVASLAYQAYREYQAQLMKDLEPIETAKDHIIIPDLLPQCRSVVGVLALDMRGKAFRQKGYPYHANSNDKLPMLGTPQWNDIMDALSPQGSLRNADVLVLITPSPLVWMGRIMTEIGAWNVNDLEGYFAAKRNIPELAKLLKAVKDWKDAGRGRRVVSVGGDTHIGAISQITYRGRPFCKQITASAISNPSYTALEATIAEIALSVDNIDVVDGFSFHHSSVEPRNNYGVVSVSPNVLDVELQTNESRSWWGLVLSKVFR